jgi:hypothetical protein
MSGKMRTIIGFVIAPLVVPLSFALFQFWFGNGVTPFDQFIGIVLNYGAYAYIFALFVGLPTLLLLRRFGLRGPIALGSSGALIGLLGASIFYALGLRSIQALGISFGAGAIAGFVFWLVAESPRNAAAD